MIVQPLIGATPKQSFRATYDGVTAFPNVIYDKQAPFQIGTTGWAVSDTNANNRVVAQFVRIGGAIAIGGTATVALGVATAGAGPFTNETGVALAAGDYAWMTAGITPVLAADDPDADVFETNEERQAREDREAKETPDERKARLEREAKETPDERRKRTMAELRALRKAQAQQLPADKSKGKIGETAEERALREAEEAEYQKAERERANKKAHS